MFPSFQSTSNLLPSMGDRYQSLVRQWVLRLLIDAQGYRWMFNRGRLTEEQLIIDLDIVDSEFIDLGSSELLHLLRNTAKSSPAVNNLPDGQLGHNLHMLGDAISLSQVEREVLGFMVLKEQDSRLGQAVDLFHQRRLMGSQQLVTLISIALQRSRCMVRQAFRGDSPLRQCGLISSEDHYSGVNLLDGLDDLLTYEEDGPQALFKSYTHTVSTPDLTPPDFLHVKQDYQRIRNYIGNAGAKGVRGMNVLIYGAPGTGKTEMVRVLTHALGIELYEVKSAYSDGRPMNGGHRLAAYQMAQHMLAANRKSVLLFDEVEDVFNDNVSSHYKACINRILELNPRPSFWLTNNISGMDPAYVRRFDLVLKMPELDQKARLKIARQILKGINVREEWLMALSQRKGIHAAHLAQAARVVKHSGIRKPERLESEIDAILASLYQALGHREKRQMVSKPPEYYKPAFSNTDISLAYLAKGLKRSRMGRVCLFGPPGTGKTGFAHYLAEQLKMPLVSRKASDLLDMYLGGTEKALAAAFAEASEKSAILLIDEADSFLTCREQAQHHWEISQVNELLVQMEQYNGVLVMSTNYIEHLDSAALRRFDFKVRFDYLNTDQVWMLFNNLLGRVHDSGYEPTPVEDYLKALRALTQLTPGDFATVERHHRVLGEVPTPQSLLEGLQREQQIKTYQQGRSIGFI